LYIAVGAYKWDSEASNQKKKRKEKGKEERKAAAADFSISCFLSSRDLDLGFES